VKRKFFSLVVPLRGSRRRREAPAHQGKLAFTSPAVRTMGAIVSEKTAGKPGKLRSQASDLPFRLAFAFLSRTPGPPPSSSSQSIKIFSTSPDKDRASRVAAFCSAAFTAASTRAPN
jgi:hypothetical protein